MARKHDSLREGAQLGLVVATSIWVWLAVVDAAVGQPFRTFTVLAASPSSPSCITCSTSSTASSSCPWSTAPRASRVS